MYFLRFFLVTLTLFLSFRSVSALTWDPRNPLEQCGDEYWKWGPDDQRGANNYQTSEKVLEAKDLIKEGKVYHLTTVYNRDTPLFPGAGRTVSVVIPDAPAGKIESDNRMAYNDEFFAGAIGQMGTQYDGLGHVSTYETDSSGNDIFHYYNGYTGKDVHGPFGLKKLGVHLLEPYFTRGLLLDFARFHGVEIVAEDHVIRKNEFFDVLRSEGLRLEDITEGSLVIIHTGYNQIRLTDPEQYYGAYPGLDLETLEFLALRRVSVVSSDGSTPAVFPDPDFPGTFEPDHNFLLVCAGMGILEQMEAQKLADDQVYEFAWIWYPLTIEGATGSPGGGVAVV